LYPEGELPVRARRGGASPDLIGWPPLGGFLLFAFKWRVSYVIENRGFLLKDSIKILKDSKQIYAIL
jgi:hypothetical protein